MSFQLSPDQVNAVNGIVNQFLDPSLQTHTIAVLTGSAGVGKTTVVEEIIRQIEILSASTHIALAATTHRAAEVLEDIVVREVSTMHKLFKLRPGITKNGKETLRSSGAVDIPYGSVVCIDEGSMLGNMFLSTIADTIKSLALRVLIIGDPFQLPPPKDTCSLFDGSLPTYTLTQVHRQNQGNPILDKAIEFREYIAGNRMTMPTLETCLNAAGEGIHVLPHADFVAGFVKKYVNYAVGDPVDIPLCTYTNESAIDYNAMIRKATYFLEATVKPFYPGERLVANSIVKKGDTIVLTNNEVVRVIEYTEVEYATIPGYNVIVKGAYNDRTKTDLKSVFVPRTKAAADKVLNQLKNLAKNGGSGGWLKFYELKQSLGDLRPPFAGTTHKAQGGTYPAVFIDQVNIRQCRNPAVTARLMYVALTRASRNVYLNG